MSEQTTHRLTCARCGCKQDIIASTIKKAGESFAVLGWVTIEGSRDVLCTWCNAKLESPEAGKP
jgi:hypothetical protein